MSSRNGSSSKDDAISPLELESLANHGDTKGGKGGGVHNASSALPSNPVDKIILLVKLYFDLYPRAMLSGSAFTVGLLLWAWSPWQSWHSSKYSHRNHMTHEYSNMQDNFNFKTAQVDHWCLFGGDDRCYCEDPTEGSSRTDVPGWSKAHLRNKDLIQDAMDKERVDVVFFGDHNVQAWDGHWLDRPAPEGAKIAKEFNDTFNSQFSDLKAVPMGIYGDRTNNILWRIQHGELPLSLNPKVIWLMMGTNDLAMGMCSEEVVTLGMMRVAEEIHHRFPESIVVVQGILPRSNHRDGSLEGKENAKQYSPQTQKEHHWWLFHSQHEAADGPGVGAGANHGSEYLPPMPGTRRMAEGKRSPIDANWLETQGANNMMDAQEQEEVNTQHRHLSEEDDDEANDDGDDDGDDDEADDDDDGEDGDGEAGDNNESESKDDEEEEEEEVQVQPQQQQTSFSAGAGATVPLREYGAAEKEEDKKIQEEEAKDISAATIVKYTNAEVDIEKIDHKAPQPYHDYYLWPSIKAINSELEKFCALHEHFVYFDAANLVLGSIGNNYYRSEHMSIIPVLMPNFIHLSALGHEVLMRAINDELKRIIYEDDESNDIEKMKKKEGGKLR